MSSELSARQRQCLAVYAQTGSQVAAAHQLGISPQTLKNTLTTAYAKLGVAGALEAFRVLGWLRPR